MQLIMDVTFALIFFLPLYFGLAYLFVDYAWTTFRDGVTLSPMWGAWHPETWPFRTVVAFGIVLLCLRATVILLEDMAALFFRGRQVKGHDD